MLPTSSVVWRAQSLMRDRWYLLVTAAAADEIASSSKLLWKFLLRVIALSMCSSNVVFCYSTQSFLEQYKRVGGGASWRKPSLSVLCMFLLVGIINTNFFYNYDNPTTGLQTQSILYQLLLNLPKPVRASLAPLFLHPKEAQDYISRAWSKQSTSGLFISESLPLSSPKYQIRSLLLIPSPVPDFLSWMSVGL